MLLMACFMLGVSGLSTALVIYLSTDNMMPNAVWTSDYKDIPPQIVPWGYYAFLHLLLHLHLCISEPTKIKTGYALMNSFFFLSFLPSLIRRCQDTKWVCEHLIPAVYSKWGWERKQEGQEVDSPPGDPWKPTPTFSQCREAHTVPQNKRELLIQSSCSLGQTMLGCLPTSD